MPESDCRGGFARLIAEARSCRRCAADLPLGPRPVVRGLPSARLLIISQAPGTRAHATGLSFDDASGDRLRTWLALGRTAFYDEARVAIMPIGFCYPGRAARGGDRPPRPECAPLWHDRLLIHFAELRLTLLVGAYAVRYYLPQSRRRPLATTLASWREFLPDYFVLPHPSWRTTMWERRNPWFAAEVLPELRRAVAATLDPAA
jgi:uracil-DNA glycosylase